MQSNPLLNVDGTIFILGVEELYLDHTDSDEFREHMLDKLSKSGKIRLLQDIKNKIYENQAETLQAKIVLEGASTEILDTLAKDMVEYGYLPIFFYLFSLAYKSIGNLQLYISRIALTISAHAYYTYYLLNLAHLQKARDYLDTIGASRMVGEGPLLLQPRLTVCRCCLVEW